ncbi:DNA polymerase subunit gamma-1-like [Ostrea edulis]|uniref:DNA polymerase subunit gamma-1-like n=1 Tax=Ostrea edulis TaxID=37623 RepID=UPI0020963A69|nr:DNA polymerase subunit gamma-1-like [Ostrea edulis]
MTACTNSFRPGFHTWSYRRRLLARFSEKRVFPLSHNFCMVNILQTKTKATKSTSRPRVNEINIQLLPENLHKQVFPNTDCTERETVTELKDIKENLAKHGLWGKETTVLNDVNLNLPELQGKSVTEHFYNIANEQINGYIQLTKLLMAGPIPQKPKKWSQKAGWTRYDAKTGKPTAVECPGEDIFVFDVEILVKEGHYPTLATALSPTNWYSWCSEAVLMDKFRWTKNPRMSDLIPLESSPKEHSSHLAGNQKKIVIGHNVGFDRSFIKEQYNIKKSCVRFLDTMSLHIAVCGMTSFQQILYQSSKKETNRKDVREYLEMKSSRREMVDNYWTSESTMNNLNDVYQHHCGGAPLKKATRDVFVKGDMADVREMYQELCSYCAADVEATLHVFRKVWPQFLERFPNPVTLSGMLEMGTAYLPINQNWERYINQSDAVYDDLQNELSRLLQKLANEACELLHDDKYEGDLWLWDLDWSVNQYKLNKPKKKPSQNNKEKMPEQVLEDILATKDRIPKTARHMIGYPAWYRELCPRKTDKDWKPGPSLISTSRRITPKLLRMTYKGYPLHYADQYGWGFLIPDKHKAASDRQKLAMAEGEMSKFPIKNLFKMCNEAVSEDLLVPMSDKEIERMLNSAKDDMEWMERAKHLDEAGIKKQAKKKDHILEVKETKYDIGIPGCWFQKLPHKDGKGSNVGNPLSKDFLPLIETGVLKSLLMTAETVLKLTKMCSYWKNNKDRISGQMAVEWGKEDLPDAVTSDLSYNVDGLYGAIVPRVVPAGTITRRAVEKTWMTASNAYTDRVGSEMKSMIQSPPGYHFVGADVDSQELWIAAIIGDSKHRIHGSTPFGWMTLQGNKSDRTDLHSKTAETAGISRDHAKVLNYGRIYGAGQKFAETLLMNFNHNLTSVEAAAKAKKLYETTKGRRKREHRRWEGGTESEMFNMLESIAKSSSPKTPVLRASISKVLEPEIIGDEFMTSRINWVVQSSAVDYLHLMLVCMNWLCNQYDINARFAISIHDEVRYLVASKDRYRAVLALQITNLFTRCMFARALGMNDLPQSVAFFSKVDIDQCLRKEVTLECRTPSNPNGMERAYNIPMGEGLDIYETLDVTNGSLSRLEDSHNEKAELAQ